jgi:hypothetical protein
VNVEERPAGMSRTTAWAVGALGTFLIMGLLVGALIRYTRPEDLTAARAAERARFLAEVLQTETPLVTTYGWIDREKGFVRVPVERGMELMLKEWQDPAAARSNLIVRVQKAKELPPPPPEPENPYE